MPTPFYADIGKRANDVFAKGYQFGVYKLDVKSKSEGGVDFSSGIVANHASGKVFGSLQSKIAAKDYGVSLTEKWNTDNILGTDITVSNLIAGLSITLEGTFAPHTGAKTAKLKKSFARNLFAINSNMDINPSNPIIDLSAVINVKGWLVGSNVQYDFNNSKMSKNNVALGYNSAAFDLCTFVNNGKEFGSSIYQKVSDKMDFGITMRWVAGSHDTLFGLAVRLSLDENTTVHAKLDNKSILGLGYVQKLRPGTTLTMSAAVDGQKLKEGGYKVGVGMDVEL